MIPKYFDGIKIITGEQIYPVEIFISDAKRILNYKDHNSIGKAQLDMKFNAMILGMAFESEEVLCSLIMQIIEHLPSIILKMIETI